MKAYLKGLQKKSPAHQRRFAILVSGAITAFIFIVWSFVNFSSGAPLAEENAGSVQLAAVSEADASFLQEIFSRMGGYLGDITDILFNGR